MTKMRDRINKLPWVKSARVERHFPNKISLTLVERTPMARWQTNRTLKLIDIHGDVIPRVDLARFSNLPIIVFGNLPYNISTQILAKLLTPSNDDNKWEKLFLMFQLEVANRIVAKPNTKQYGRLSLFSQFYSFPSLELSSENLEAKHTVPPTPKSELVVAEKVLIPTFSFTR